LELDKAEPFVSVCQLQEYTKLSPVPSQYFVPVFLVGGGKYTNILFRPKKREKCQRPRVLRQD
jgi:hypothetical protein